MSPALASVLSSTSQMATTSPWRLASAESAVPLPPTPIQAKRIFSLGDLLSSAAAVPETNTPTPVRAVVLQETATIGQVRHDKHSRPKMVRTKTALTPAHWLDDNLSDRDLQSAVCRPDKSAPR